MYLSTPFAHKTSYSTYSDGGVPRSSLLGGMLAYWKLDEVSGARIDAFAGRSLTDNNTVTSVAGKINLAAEFTAGNSESLSLAGWNVFQPESTPRSIAFWFKTSDVTQVKGITGVGEVPQSAVPQWFFRLNASHLSLYAGIDGGGTHNYTDGTTVLTNDTWYHVIYTYGHPGQNVYLNNALEITDADGRDGASQNDDNLYLGVGFPGFMTVVIDEYGAWARVLTSSERAVLYGAGNPPSYPFTGL